MSEYASVRVGKLRLKGAAGAGFGARKKKSKRKRERHGEENQGLRHGHWRQVQSIEGVGDRCLFLTCTGGYLRAEDTGAFCIGEPCADGDTPHPAEVFTVVRVGETKLAFKSAYGRYVGVTTSGELAGRAEAVGPRLAFKSAYGRYVGVTTSGELAGRAEAVGPREQWELVFEEGNAALSACNHRFLAVTEGGKLVAASEKAREREIMIVWCDAPLLKKAKVSLEEEEDLASRDMASLEVDYVKKFQSFQDRKLRVSSESHDGLDRARREGKLHEALLDRREKMKADRYCK